MEDNVLKLSDRIMMATGLDWFTLSWIGVRAFALWLVVLFTVATLVRRKRTQPKETVS